MAKFTEGVISFGVPYADALHRGRRAALHVSDGQAQHPAFMGFPLCLLPKDPMSLPQPLCNKDITSLPQSADHYAPKPSPLFLHFATDLLHS